MSMRQTLSQAVERASKSTHTLFVGDDAIKTFRQFVYGDISRPKTTKDVLLEEYRTIWGGYVESEAKYRECVQQKGQAALCLSGGGIRSAAFSLGVIQELATHGLLTQFHYLSTVSGGGYIGGWLSRWIADDPDQNAVNIENALKKENEICQISNLRAYSNFLTPKVGLTSADTWTGILLWVRNVLLNWTVFIPALLFAVLVPNFALGIMRWLAELGPTQDTWWAGALLLIGAISLTIATWQNIENLPSHRNGSGLSSTAVRWKIVVPRLAWAGLMPLVLAAGRHLATSEPKLDLFYTVDPIVLWFLIFSFGAAIVGYILAYLRSKKNSKLYVINFPTWVILVGISTGALWLAITFINYLGGLFSNWPDKPATLYALTILGPLGGTLAHLLLSSLYAGFRQAGFQDDADREWLARTGAVSFFPAVLWTIFTMICLFLPFVLIDHGWLWTTTWPKTVDFLVKALGVIAGFAAVFGGKSASLQVDTNNGMPKSGFSKAYALVVRVATLIFIAFLFMVLAHVERIAAEAVVNSEHHAGWWSSIVVPRLFLFLAGFVLVYLGWWLISRVTRVLVVGALVVGVLVLVILCLIPWFADNMKLWIIDSKYSEASELLIAQAFIAAGLFVITAVASMKIDVNRFSMHGTYRNRLVRAFLGGARARRKEDPFTHFDAADNRRVSELRATNEDGARVIYPVINVTLNLVGGENLAWQERKASSFIITPLYCGSAALGAAVDVDGEQIKPRRWAGAYIETKEYGGKEPDLDRVKTGISLGTAITISGAAASPNMGYNSAASTAFLMTLFNVRLGVWLANPAALIRKEEVKAGPTSALKPLLTEALGLTDGKSDNVYLSDGGHFDNLGIYEMIRRRCRYMLVVDADADENFAFEDLARSVR